MIIKKISAIVTIRFVICIIGVLFSTIGWTQNFDLGKEWVEIGPIDNPIAKSQSAAGLGPVEFIRISKNNPNLMLAGSLMGGLFYSNNSGDTWQNAGSDSWSSSNCGWAEINPSDDNMWFAVSMRDGYNGGPGDIGKSGGIYRTLNKGATWESVANYSVFDNAMSTVIYGLRFHPTEKKKLYALTSKGLFFAEDCTTDYLEWTKVQYLKGTIYDLEVNSNFLCFSLKNKAKWQVMISDKQRLVPIPEVEKSEHIIEHITIEKANDKFYLLLDFKGVKDEIWEYDPVSKKIKIIYKLGRVSYGAGYTYAINPFNANEMMIGSGLRIKKWLVSEQTYENIDNNYHVDVECVAYHPTIIDTYYIGTHGGVFKTTDGGKSWEFKSFGLGNTEVLAMSISANNPEVMAIGLFHGGTLLRSDWNHDGKYQWKQVNGGDALIPIINPNADSIVYTSNQYSGGGLYFSIDTASNNKLLHSRSSYATPGWSMAAKLHPVADTVLFYNFTHQKGSARGNIDIIRSARPHDINKAEVISNFGKTHDLNSYQVFGLFTSNFHPELLFAYVIGKVRIEGKLKTAHKLFMLPNSLDTSSTISEQWVELELPRNDWIGGVSLDPKKWNKMYVSYAAGVTVKASSPDDKGMLYHTKYRKSDYSLRRNWDISASIPSARGGSNNLIITSEKYVFVGTSTGVYFGNKSTLKGGKSWVKVGGDLPNCKVSGLFYDESSRWLTVSYNGRGVWRYDLSPSK